jgi:hypothetical protein
MCWLSVAAAAVEPVTVVAVVQVALFNQTAFQSHLHPQ